MRKPGLTVAEHKMWGPKLAGWRNETQFLMVKLLNSYPHHSRVGRLARRAEKAVADLRSELDSAMAREHPVEFEVTVYYPPVK